MKLERWNKHNLSFLFNSFFLSLHSLVSLTLVYTPTRTYFWRQKSTACFWCKLNCKKKKKVDVKLKFTHQTYKFFWKSFR